MSTVEWDERYWPVVPDQPEPRGVVRVGTEPRPRAGERAPGVATTPTAADARRPTPVAEMAPNPGGKGPAASGMEFGSPLLEVFQFTRSPSAFAALGGRTVWWRLTVYGAGGEILGIRELTHQLDCRAAARDRLEYGHLDKVYSRSDGAHYASRQGMPWPTDAERGRHELALFGLHMRMPWCFGDGVTFGVERSQVVERDGERLRSVTLERRPQQGSGLIGPTLDAGEQDTFELVYDPATGTPRELVHRFAAAAAGGGGARRVLLEDWREYEGVRIPFRRVYVDEALRRTTMLEILDIQQARLTERTFRSD